MGHFKQVTQLEDNDQLTAVYQEIVESGFGDELPINWFTSQGSRPDILKATWSLCKGVLMEGQVPMTLKQMILTVVSNQNNCRYCTELHSSVLHSLGVAKDVVQSCLVDVDSAKVTQAQREILRFALKVAENPTQTTEEDIQKLKKNGLSEQEVIEISMLVAFTNFINTWADISGIPLESESAKSRAA